MILFLFFFALCHPLTVLATVDSTAGLPAAVPIQPLTENPDIEAQLKGDYPPLDRPGGGDDGPDPFSPPATLDDLAQRRGAPLSGASLPLGAIQQAWNHAGPQAGVYQVTYHPHEVIRLRCRELMTTTLVFPSWERLDILRVGDPASFKVDHPQPHLVLLQPQAFMGVDTTLLAVGASGKVYTFYLRAKGYNTKHVPDVTVYIRVPKPAELLITKEQLTAEAVDYLEEATFEPEKLSFRFDMRGDASIAPQRVYADGIRTWFDYGDSIGQKDLPAVYRVIDGVDTPLNVTRQGTKLMAQGTGAFTLISGQKVVCITPPQPGKTMKLFIPVLGLALGLMGCQEDKPPRPAQPPQSLVKGLFDFTRVSPPPVPVTPPPVPALRPVLFPDPAPLLREERARALRGLRHGRVMQQLKAVREEDHLRPQLQDEDYQRWADATFAATTSTLPVERTRILTADMRIPALLEDALISHVGGRVIALVERDVLNPEGKVILLPAYSRLICHYKPLEARGPTRLGLTCTRLIRPDGVSVDLKESSAADQAGRMGLSGDLDQHWGPKYGAAFLMAGLSALSTLSAPPQPMGTPLGPSLGSPGGNPLGLHTATTPLAQHLGDVTAQLIEQQMNLPPVLTLPAGSRIHIIPATDIVLRQPPRPRADPGVDPRVKPSPSPRPQRSHP